jgi:hypothetical protein
VVRSVFERLVFGPWATPITADTPLTMGPLLAPMSQDEKLRRAEREAAERLRAESAVTSWLCAQGIVNAVTAHEIAQKLLDLPNSEPAWEAIHDHCGDW